MSSNRTRTNTAILIALTLLISGVFKLSAFVREAFIASHFGVSQITDAYFGLQQFPLALGTFMFGAFALAFAPAYAETKRRSGKVTWMAGLLFYGCTVGAVLTLIMILNGPALLKLIGLSPTHESSFTLTVLSLSCLPIVCIGFWAGICAARGSNLCSMAMTSAPYLVMTAMLFLSYFAGSLGNQSLAISMTAGFVLLGFYGFIRIIRTEPIFGAWNEILTPWRFVAFREFFRNLMASSLENGGFALNQLLMMFFLARSGPGMISGNSYAMRIGMLGYSLFSQPIAQLMQARLCVSGREQNGNIFRRSFLIVWAGISLIAVGLYVFRIPVIQLVYMRGRFTETELQVVADILPAWIGYLVVMSLNAVVARYLFMLSQGATYVRWMLCAYAAANLFRFLASPWLSAPGLIWCSVIAESCAMLVALRICLKREPQLFAAMQTEEVCS